MGTNHLVMINMLLPLTSEHVRKDARRNACGQVTGSQLLVTVVKTSRVLKEEKGHGRGRKEVPKDGDKGCVWFL